MSSIRSLLRALFRRDAMNREMNDEIRDHLAQATERLMARGMSRADAESAARREFGNVAVHAENGRDARGARWVETLRGDIRYGLRSLRASPSYAAVAILSLAVAIGANTAIFSLINAVMLKPLPVYRPDALLQVTIRDSAPDNPASRGNPYFTNPIWENLRDQTREYASYAVSDYTGFSLVSGGEIRSARGSYVNGGYFATLGVQPLLGRVIASTDDYRGCPATVVLGEAFWQSEFGGARDVLGRSILLEGKSFRVLGVVPREFFGVDVGTVQQVYVPLCAEAVIRGAGSALSHRSNWWLRVIARPAPEVSASQLAERLRTITRSVMEVSLPPDWTADRRAEFTSAKFTVAPAFNGLSAVRERYARSLKILMGMVGLILLIACGNVANLSLARGASRGRELAVRIAIGASRGRVMRQLLTEAALVAGIGTLAGVAMAAWATRSLVALLSTSRSNVLLDLSPDVTVLGFTMITCIATVLMFALVPAWRATRVDPQAAMKAGGRGTVEGHNRFRLGKGLVVAQSALAFVLVVGAGLLVTSFTRLTKSDLGFQAEGLLGVRLRLSGSVPPAGVAQDVPRTPGNRAAVIQRLRSQMATIPGVVSVSTADITPIQGPTWNEQVVVEGDPVTAQEPALAWFNSIGASYFQTMGTKLRAGRDFGPQDAPTSEKVAVVNEAAARLLFKDASPIGKVYRTKVRNGFGERTTIVGVVENSRYASVRESAEPIIYLSDSQDPDPGASAQFVVRAGSAIPSVISAVRAMVESTDPGILLQFTRLEDQVAQSLQRERALATLSGFFGILALGLAMIGLYGVMAYTVARRRVEIGIRVALGAVRGRVIRLVLGDVAMLVGAGLAIGGVIALTTTRVLGSLLYGIEARDPWTLAGAAVVLAGAALLAGAIPARRAAGLQPLEALRED